MFNIGKKDQGEEFFFDIEKEIKNPQRKRELNDMIQSRIQKIKESLRSGQSEEDFEKLGALLHGYTSLVKVLARVKSNE